MRILCPTHLDHLSPLRSPYRTPTPHDSVQAEADGSVAKIAASITSRKQAALWPLDHTPCGLSSAFKFPAVYPWATKRKRPRSDAYEASASSDDTESTDPANWPAFTSVCAVGRAKRRAQGHCGGADEDVDAEGEEETVYAEHWTDRAAVRTLRAREAGRRGLDGGRCRRVVRDRSCC